MISERLPDCRPPRPDARLTSASAHPELICGEFAMHPRIPVTLDSADRAAINLWSRRMIVGSVLFVAAVVLVSAFIEQPDPRASVLASSPPADIARVAQMP